MSIAIAGAVLGALVSAATLSPEQAAQAVPRAQLADLTDAQRGVFVEVAGDVFNYAGCQETLAKCLAAGVKDPHALREASLVHELARENFPANVITQAVERYYSSFDSRHRQKVRLDNCPMLGSAGARVTIAEFSDFQCPHCAASAAPLRELVEKLEKGKARLCSKYFPWPAHTRARIAAACAEYARGKGRFWQWSDAVFARQESLEDPALKELAAAVGLNGDEMLKQVYSGRFDAAVESHIREGTALGVQSTPTLYIDGREHVLPVRPFYLKLSVDDELEWQKSRGFTFDKKAARADPPARARGRKQ